jgi:hypothetical protein
VTDDGEFQLMTPNEKGSKETELDVLKEILRWVKFTGVKEVRGILTSVLDDDQKRTAYQLSDGTKGMVDVGKQVGIKSTAGMSKLWKQWTKLGLGESIPVMGGNRFRRSFDLADFGIEVNVGNASKDAAESTQSAPEKIESKLEEFQQPTEEKKEQ